MAPAGPSWPSLGDSHPVCIYTLGRFQVCLDGVPLHFGRRVPHRPLALLKVLIALGAEAVPIDTLCDALWPDAEGDRAVDSLRTAVHRLRKLLGTDALLLSDARLSLNPDRCWVDVVAFQRQLESAGFQAHENHSAEAWQAAETALRLYAGPFLDGDSDPPELLSARKRLHSMFIRKSAALGDYFLGRGDSSRALRLLQSALDRDESAEDVAQRLMQIYLDLGRSAEAKRVYERLCETLDQHAGGTTSPQTEAMGRLLKEASTLPSAEPALTPDPPPVAHETARGQHASDPAVEALRREAVLPLPEQPSLVVPPFASLGDADHSSLAEGFGESIVADLAHLRNLFLVSAGSSEACRTRPLDTRRIGRELGVRHVLDGSVQREGERVRVTARLIDAATGRHLWSARYDREIRDLFLVQDDIAERIVMELEVKLIDGEAARIRRSCTHDPEVYEALSLGGVLASRVERDANIQAQACYERVLTHDPAHPVALAMLGYVHYMRARYGWSTDPNECLRTAESLAQQALAADERNPHAYWVLGNVQRTRGRYEEAIVAYRHSLQCAPSLATTHVLLGGTLVSAGRAAEALPHLRRAMRLQPYYPPWFLGALGRAYWMLGQTNEAQAAFEAVVRSGTDHSHMARSSLIALLVESGRLEQARRHASAILASDPGLPVRRLVGQLQYQDPAINERLQRALLAAGLPG